MNCSLTAFCLIIAISLTFISCDKIADRMNMSYISINYAGGLPELKHSTDSETESDSTDWQDPKMSPEHRKAELAEATAHVAFIDSLGSKFASPIDFDAPNVTLEEALTSLMASTDCRFAYELQTHPSQRISIRAKRYYPEKILRKIADFYGFAISYDSLTLVLRDKDKK